MRAVGLTRWVGGAVLSVVAWASWTAIAPSPAATARPAVAAVEPGDLVVADQRAGEVLRVPAAGEPEAVLSGLGSVRGVVVLADGAVLATDSESGTIEATGGRFGDDRVEVASGLEAPEALATSGPDQLYVSSFSAGTVSRVDIATGRVETLAADLDGPAAVLALRAPRSPTHVAVAEWFGGSVALLQRNGDRSGTLADDLARPAGLAMDGDGTVYVTDRDAGAVVAVDRTGRAQRLADLDEPAGITLDPPQPAAGQSFDLVVATADGIERVDPDTGRASTLADVSTAVGVVVAPDEFVPVARATDDSVVEGSGGGVGGDVVAADQGLDIDPVMVGLVALAVFLAGVAVVTGVQLWRSRDERDEEPVVTGTRKQRRRARRTDRAVQKAERKTAREVLRAEKRAAKMAPPEPQPEPRRARAAESEPPGVAPSPAMDAAMPLFLSDMSPADAAPGGVGGSGDVDRDAEIARGSTTPTRAEAKRAKAQAKAEAKQAAADAKAAEAAAAARARAEAKQAKVDAKAAKAQEKADAKAAKVQAKADAKHAKADVGDAATGPDAHGGVGATGGPEVDDIVALGPGGGPAGVVPTAPTIADAARTDGPASDPAPATGVASAGSVAGAQASAEVASGDAADEERMPLFASPAPAPQTPGPFLESLFATPAAPATGDATQAPPPSAAVAAPAVAAPAVGTPAVGAPVPSIAAPPPPPPLAPVVQRRPPLELAESTSMGDITDLVARDVPPPHGLLGRRRAKRRHRAAEHRHQQLRAITALIDVPLPATPPPRPPRTELAERGVAPAASVASPDLPPAPAALDAGAVDAGGDAGAQAVAEAGSEAGTGAAVGPGAGSGAEAAPEAERGVVADRSAEERPGAPADAEAGSGAGRGAEAGADTPVVAVPWPDGPANGATGSPHQPWPGQPAR